LCNSLQNLFIFLINIGVCINGCRLYIPNFNTNDFTCHVCKFPRYSKCRFPKCNSSNDSINCGHNLKYRSHNSELFYFSVTERISRLIESDIGIFLEYPKLRREPIDGYIEDILDGSAWKNIKSLCHFDEILIGIFICWDGANINNIKGCDSFWPLSYWIVNFPVEIRYKQYLGLHLAFLDLGNYASLDLFFDEMLYIWNNNITINNKKYKVAIIGTNFDTRGREKFDNVQGAGSLEGCYE